jgi:hypothetical protein
MLGGRVETDLVGATELTGARAAIILLGVVVVVSFCSFVVCEQLFVGCYNTKLYNFKFIKITYLFFIFTYLFFIFTYLILSYLSLLLFLWFIFILHIFIALFMIYCSFYDLLLFL